MQKILSTVACNLDNHLLAACLPLLEESKIDAIEWSFDTLFKVNEMPPWFRELLTAFSHEGRLIGHGVFFSLFSGKWLPEQEQWLQQLKQTCTRFQFDHITEHFGFMTGKDFHQGAPLSIPYTAVTLCIGTDRLKRIYDACHCPVGLENLAFSYSLEEVKRHGEFLDKLLKPVNGFIILDLHNLYCQLHNFELTFEEMMMLYPLHRVREIHISGGSWDEPLAGSVRKVRRDTHDDAVPEDVFRLLEQAIHQCPHLKYVVMEQLGNALSAEEGRHLFRSDFLRMKDIVSEMGECRSIPPRQFLPKSFSLAGKAIEDEELYQQQRELATILESSSDYEEAMTALSSSSLAASEWQIEKWTPHMLETAVKIARKWQKG
jgi:uncharacterized protein (UPF0276 family)